jgi:alpha-mannosidase
MLEIGRRLADWPLPDGAAGVRFGKAGEQMRKIADQADELPVWDGELYLEYHRGTYTSQAWLKRANRRAETALHDAEWTASLARLVGVDVDWDQAAIGKLWQDLLLAQFHDILPGSSVHEVYEEFRPIMRHLLDSARATTAGQLERLAAAIDTREFTRPVVLFNPLSWDRTEPIELPDGRWVDHLTVPAAGWTVVDADAATVTEAPVVLSVDEAGRQLTNRWWRLRLDDHGRIVELHDRVHDRPVITPDAPGNQWQVFEDRPFRYDAWDIEYYHEQSPLPGPTCTSIEVVETGEQRLVVELVWHMPAPGMEDAGSEDEPAAPRSEIRQHLILYGRSSRIDFQTTADWHEHHQLLKVAFPVNVRAREANYEIQFGHLARPTHRNTSWDFARFEICGHRWVDLAEPGYGVAMLNDCKYGHSVHENVMRMTCIKSAQQPDATADQGRHEFTYALLPHAGSLQDAGVIRHAAELNQPILVQPTEPSAGDLSAEHRAIACDHPAVIVDTLKPAEDGDGLILRAYESHGSHVRATLEFATPPKKVALCDLLEQPIAKPETPIEHEGQTVRLSLRPFQVITLRLKA